MGGIAQKRYEQLRSRWFAAGSGGIFALAGTSWGHRLLHFGLLGMLDEDPTSSGWFGTSPVAANSEIHCTRVLLATEDSEERGREAYRCILESQYPGWMEPVESLG